MYVRKCHLGPIFFSAGGVNAWAGVLSLYILFLYLSIYCFGVFSNKSIKFFDNIEQCEQQNIVQCCVYLSQTSDIFLLCVLMYFFVVSQIQILSETAENTEDVRSIRLHCSATRNTWANQRRKRREAAGKLKTNDAPSSSNVSGVSFESCKTESEMDHAETTKPGQKNISAVNTVSSNENLCSKTALALTNKSMDDKVVAVRDSADVICLKRALELGEMIAIATTKHPVSPDDETQNCQTPKSEKKNTTLQTSTDKISTLHTKRKETAHPETSTRKHKFLKSDEIPKNKQLFLEFHATIGVEHVDFMPDGFPQTYLQMVWISGSDKNCMYQLFQYFQNRLSS